MKVDLNTLRVDEEFRALLPPLSERERENCVIPSIEDRGDGVRDSVMSGRMPTRCGLLLRLR